MLFPDPSFALSNPKSAKPFHDIRIEETYASSPNRLAIVSTGLGATLVGSLYPFGVAKSTSRSVLNTDMPGVIDGVTAREAIIRTVRQQWKSNPRRMLTRRSILTRRRFHNQKSKYNRVIAYLNNISLSQTCKVSKSLFENRFGVRDLSDIKSARGPRHVRCVPR